MQSYTWLDLEELRELLANLIVQSSTDNMRMCTEQRLLAFFQQESIEGSYGNNFGMPVMQNQPIGRGDFVLRQAFHASA